MKIDHHLNLVVPVERADGVEIYVHSAPISRQSFDQNFLVISKTFTAIYAEGLNSIAGPRVASKLLKRIAGIMGEEEAVEKGLMAEIRRLMNVIVPGDRGWTHMPIDVAIQQGLIELEDVDEVENAVTFFTVISSMHKKKDARAILKGAVQLWSAETSSLSLTDYIASLRTLTKPASTGAKVLQSSIPS